MSGILRIICGLAVLILTFITYQKTFTGFEEGDRLRLWGYETSASSGLLTAGFGVVGLIGALILIMGIVSLLKSKN